MNRTPTEPTDAEIAEQAAELAHALFLQEEWTYHDGIPTVNRLAEAITDLLSTIRHENVDNVESGRFVVERQRRGYAQSSRRRILLELYDEDPYL